MNNRSKLILTTFVSLASLTLFSLGADHPVASVAAEPALAKLKEGNARFVESTVSSGKPTAAKRTETAQGQHPFAIIVGCADSRTSPEIIFDQNIGDLFVTRNAGNLVDEHALGSIEYAVEHLGVRLIVVMGHSSCGAVTAAVAGETAPGHIQSLVRDIQPAVKTAKNGNGSENLTERAIAENARLMANKIRTEADFGELAKEVRVIPAVYDLSSGKVEWLKD